MTPLIWILTEYAISCSSLGYVKYDLLEMIKSNWYEVPVIKRYDDDWEFIEEYEDIDWFIKKYFNI